MNRTYFALFVALLVHLILILIFWILGSAQPKKEHQDEKRMKVDLKEVNIKPKDNKEALPPPITQKPDIPPPMPKGSQLKELVKYNEKKAKQQPLPANKLKEQVVEEKVAEQKKIEPLPPQKPYIPLEEIKAKEEKKEKSSDPLAWMKEDKSSQESKEKQAKDNGGNKISSDIRELYGDEFGKLSPEQQKYLLDNQEIMRRITQEVLNRVASVNLRRDMNVNSTNIIEFYLHPNGDMTDFRFLKKSGYFILDETTKETIEYAYSRYPRPSEKTLIRYNVFYNLARY